MPFIFMTLSVVSLFAFLAVGVSSYCRRAIYGFLHAGYAETIQMYTFAVAALGLAFWAGRMSI